MGHRAWLDIATLGSLMGIRSKVLTAVRWTAAARFLGQLVSWAITIFVIRILAPADYGLMAMATVLLSFLYLIHDFGLDAVLIQKKDLDEGIRRRIFGVVIVVNLLIFTGLELFAPVVASFFHEPELVAVIRVLAFQFFLFMFETLPLTKLERELDFKNRSIVDLVTLVLGSMITLLLALAGFGVWALIWGNLATIATRIVGLNIIAPCLCRPQFSWRAMQDVFSFGRSVSVDRTLWFVFAESDKFIGGRMLGTEPLGIYAVASHLASLPINKVAGLIKSIAFPAFSQVQADLSAVREYLLKAVRVMSIAIFPIFFGMSSVASEIVTVLLGEKWLDVVLPLQILAIVMPLRMISTVMPPVLWGVGKPTVSAINYLIAAIIMPLALVYGARWGPVGLAMAWLVAYPIIYVVTIVRTVRVIQLSASKLFGAMWRPALAGGVMYIAVIAARHFLPTDLGGVARLVTFVVTGIGVYSGLVFAFYREGVNEIQELLKG